MDYDPRQTGVADLSLVVIFYLLMFDLHFMVNLPVPIYKWL